MARLLVVDGTRDWRHHIEESGFRRLVRSVSGVGVMDAPIQISALRAIRYSADSQEVTIGLATKYSGAERQYVIPIECFYDLITDLQRLNAPSEAGSPENPYRC